MGLFYFFLDDCQCAYTYLYMYLEIILISVSFTGRNPLFFVAEITHEHCITNYANLCICRKSNLFVVVIAVVLVVIVVVLVARVVVLDGSSLLFLKL